ncbi:MAG: hypothetical protein H6R15_60 [Proteobacteria bacterium]|nr:hypothetical protein [Pseudomonadota bacterium]
MADPFVGQIGTFGFDFAPRGWSFCNGTTLLINQNQALYSLLGIQFGGNGTSNFNLPDLRGRVPVHIGTAAPPLVSYNQGNTGGAEMVQLDATTMPAHSHTVSASNDIASAKLPPTTAGLPFYFAQVASGGQPIYGATPTTLVAMGPLTISNTGSGAGHQNMQPSLAINFCIALLGSYPSRN